jgi:mannosyl-oligosaccharide alpha-1,2-mannosidase
VACFDGGNFLLGGIVLNEQKYIDFGLALVTACEATYASTLTLIGPEGFGWSVNGTEGVPADQIEFYKKAGFYITSSAYILRPEVLESFYYAYRVTGDQKYREWAWNGYLAINKTTRAGSGYAEILNVNTEGGGAFYDVQDSFFLAEVLKYAYLIHSPVSAFQCKYFVEDTNLDRMGNGRSIIEETTSGFSILRHIHSRLLARQSENGFK